MGKDPHRSAQDIWVHVLENMPAELHEKHALVEAQRQLIGLPDAAAIGDALDALAVAAFGPNQVAGDPGEAAVKPRDVGPSEDNIRQLVLDAVLDGFAATTDGSAERAQVLRQRALGNAERVIEKHASSLGWFAKRRLRAAAKEEADAQTALVLR